MTSQETQNKIEEEIITMNVATMNYFTKLITEEMFNKTRKEVIENIMAIAEKREKEEQMKIEELFQDTKSHFDYWLSPRDMDAFWATFGQRVYKYFGLPIKEENK